MSQGRTAASMSGLTDDPTGAGRFNLRKNKRLNETKTKSGKVTQKKTTIKVHVRYKG